MQRGVVIRAAMLYAVVVACGPGSESTVPRADQASGPPIAAPTRPPSAAAQITYLELPEDEAWRTVKSTLGASVLVLRPSAVPPRFAGALPLIEYAYLGGSQVRYRVGYRSAGGLIAIAAGAVNWGPPDSTETIVLRGLNAWYSTSSSWPERGIEWSEGGVVYSIQARGISKAELMEIANGLVAVP